MNSPESKERNDGEDSSELQPAMRQFAITPSTIQGLIVHPSTGLMLDDFPKADQSNDLEYNEKQFSFPGLDKTDLLDNSGILRNANTTGIPGLDKTDLLDKSGILRNANKTDKVQFEKLMEQEHFTRCKQEVLRVCHTKGGQITMADVMENKPHSSVGRFFMASLMLASDMKLQLQNKGQKAEPITMDQLFMKIPRKT